MQTSLTREFADTDKGRIADAVLRKCVHCGFCNAACPTYQILGDESDGPRGRIYLIKQLLEGENLEVTARLHLDRCLTCRACETICPSGVEYGKLLEIGRSAMDDHICRPWFDRAVRKIIADAVTNAGRFALFYAVGKFLGPVLPLSVKSKIPQLKNGGKLDWPKPRHRRRMVVLTGCVQSVVSPDTNTAAALVLDRLGISLIETEAGGCCGSVDLHTTSEKRARRHARRLIDSWWRHWQQGVEGFVVSASGCAVTIKEYPRLFLEDREYYEKALTISGHTHDICEIVGNELGHDYKVQTGGAKVAFHSPCTLQHGLKIKNKVETILVRCGYVLCKVRDDHLCCGSAGTYSLLQPEISQKLRADKLAALYENAPDIICTANVGCQMHLSSSRQRVKHWIELLV